MIRVVVFGVGYWGKNLVRNIHLSPNFQLVAVCDPNLQAAALELSRLGITDIKIFPSHSQVLNLIEFDLAIIATWPSSHFEITKACLNANKHAFVEKPFGINLNEKNELISLASNMNVKIFIDFPYLFSPEFEVIKLALKKNIIGKINYIQSSRLNLGMIQKDIGVTEDLAVHDFALVYNILQKLPLSAACTSQAINPSLEASTTFVNLVYEDGIIINIVSGWNSAIKIREFILSGERGTIIWNDTLGVDKVKIYSSMIEGEIINNSINISYHLGDGKIPVVRFREALAVELEHIFYCISHDVQSDIIGPKIILETGKILAAAINSRVYKGNPIPL